MEKGVELNSLLVNIEKNHSHCFGMKRQIVDRDDRKMDDSFLHEFNKTGWAEISKGKLWPDLGQHEKSS